MDQGCSAFWLSLGVKWGSLQKFERRSDTNILCFNKFILAASWEQITVEVRIEAGRKLRERGHIGSKSGNAGEEWSDSCWAYFEVRATGSPDVLHGERRGRKGWPQGF